MVEATYYFPDGSAGGPPEDRWWPDGEVFESTKEAVEAIQSRYGNHGTWVDWDGNLCVHESDVRGCGGWTLRFVAKESAAR